MKVLPIYINRQLAINNQKMKSPLTFTSSIKETQTAVVKITNPVLDKIRNIMTDPEMLNNINTLKLSTNNALHETIKQKNPILDIIGEKLGAHLQELKKDSDQRGIIELFTDAEADNVQRNINALLRKNDTFDLPFTIISSNVNRNAESIIEDNILFNIREAKRYSTEVYSIVLREVITGLEMLQIMLGKAVK